MLPSVAATAGRDDVPDAVIAALDERNDVIHRRLLHRLPAVGAASFVLQLAVQPLRFRERMQRGTNANLTPRRLVLCIQAVVDSPLSSLFRSALPGFASQSFNCCR